MLDFRKWISSETGAASFFAIIAMAILGNIGGAFLYLSSAEVTMAANFRDGVAAQCLAEAGVRRGLVELSHNANWGKSSVKASLGDGSYSVVVINDSAGKRIESTGMVNKAIRKVVFHLDSGVYNYASMVGRHNYEATILKWLSVNVSSAERFKWDT
ncbi:hypothetical protein [Sporomusa sp.]|uniref:hypothetical protein n=1 Tax=Sporomusa sp. TaxID=2078658 RepID=UPI002C659FB9|nr:hypothetical protein [Sporomusa sp.]HWR43647.1 hypothetical protein [Sporomusa sp.]